MKSNIIGDAKFQELNMSFSFDENYEDKIIVIAFVDSSSYQLQLVKNIHLDYDQFKNALLTKQFKLVGINPEILQLKIFFTTFQFKNFVKIDFNTLKQITSQLTSTTKDLANQIQKNTYQIQEQTLKNYSLEALIKLIRKDCDLMTTKIGDLRQIKEKTQEQTIRVIKSNQTEWEKKMQEKTFKMAAEFQQKHNLLLEKFQKNQQERLKQVEEEKTLRKQMQKKFTFGEEEREKMQQTIVRKVDEIMRAKKEIMDKLYYEQSFKFSQLFRNVQQLIRIIFQGFKQFFSQIGQLSVDRLIKLVSGRKIYQISMFELQIKKMYKFLIYEVVQQNRNEFLLCPIKFTDVADLF